MRGNGRRRTVALACLVGVVVFSAHPGITQEQKAPASGRVPTLEELDRTKALDDLVKRIQTAVTGMTREKLNHCLRAFGSPTFCTCLSEQLPVGASFMGYVQVATSTKEELGYGGLGKDDKAIFDGIIKAREICVRKAHGEQPK